MRSHTLLILSSLLSMNLFANVQPKECSKGPHAMRMTARHIEGKGVGYNQGYSTIEAFFTSVKATKDEWVQFVDIRGHAFNDGKFAANVGYGGRYMGSSRVWGGNFYYDYRKTHRHMYNQVSLGFESLGKVWDFRLNGYLPVGKTKNTHKHEFVMKGINAEVGAHVDTWENAPLYFAAGPYFLSGHGKNAWGGELRAAVDFLEYVRIEGSTSYDNVFKWIGQGQISLGVSFGPKRTVKPRGSNTCSMAHTVYRRAVQRIDRNEIMPVKNK